MNGERGETLASRDLELCCRLPPTPNETLIIADE